jgi:hypothetical protein
MQESNEIYMLTTNQFNPHDDSYVANKDSMLDWEGNMVEKKHRTQVLLSKVVENEAMASSIQVSSIESRAINRALETSDDKEGPVKPRYDTVPRATDGISSVLVPVSPILDDMVLYQRLSVRSELGRFQTLIGSTDAPGNDYILEDDATEPSTNESNDEKLEDENDD